jgi:fructokinase
MLEEAALKLLDLGPEIVVITMGEAGSYFQVAEGGSYIPPFSVDTVDSVGCGDAFVAGLLSGLVSHENWRESLSVDSMKECLIFANAVGALTSLKRGTIPAMPYLRDVERFLEQNK